MRQLVRRFVSAGRDEGFTMAELVVAMLVIGIVLVVLTAIQISAALTIRDARVRQEATAYANQAIEQMRAIPWNVLSKGLDHDFYSASGGSDPYVSGLTFEIDGEDPVPLVIATAAQDQDTANPWEPLFDASGSNKQVVHDPSGFATEYTIRAYVTRPSTYSEAELGLVVVVEWPDRRGRVNHTMVRTTAYRGSGCGGSSALDTQPYLAACQANLDASSSSGSVVSILTASSVANGVDPVVALPILGPASSSNWYSVTMRTAGVASEASTQQISVVRGIDQYGGTVLDDNDPGTIPEFLGWTSGFDIYEARASDDPAWTDVPLDAGFTTVPASTAELEQHFEYNFSGNASDTLRVRTLSDFRRTSTAKASSVSSCDTGIPSGAPCAKSTLSNYASWDGGSGYVLLDVEGTIFRLSRRLAEDYTNEENAWATRFSETPGLGAAGCTTVSGEGCVSARADRTMATLSIGTVVNGTKNWDGAAGDGLVQIQGRVGCAHTAGLWETVSVERGASQPATAATIDRCGQIRYWNGGSYTTKQISTAADSVTTDTVTWTGTYFTIEAQATVTLYAPTEVSQGSTCDTAACEINADAGVITVLATYTITHGSDTWVLYSTTVINPPTASASFLKAPVE